MNMKHPIIFASLSLLTLLFASCEAPPAEEVYEQSFARMAYYHFATDPADLENALLRKVEGAERTIDLAVAQLESARVADALIAAKNRGVTVRVVTDNEAAATPQIAKLIAASVPVTLGDGPLTYLPDPTLTSILQDCTTTNVYVECTRRQDTSLILPTDGVITRPDGFNVMSSNFAVVDGQEIWASATPLLGAAPAIYVGWTSHSQDLGIAFSREFQQMFGGVTATTLDQFNAPIKSTVHGIVYDSNIADSQPGKQRKLQPGYLTSEGVLEIQFNPQQRLAKEVIDEIYGARGSVYFMTDELVHGYAIDALLYKVQAGFDVRIIVNEGTPIPEALKAAGVVRTIDASYLPTMILTNHTEDLNGELWPRKAAVLSHPLYHEAPFRVLDPVTAGNPLPNDVVRVYPSDLFVDGTLWTMNEYNGSRSEKTGKSNNELERLVVRWLDLWDNQAKAAQ